MTKSGYDAYIEFQYGQSGSFMKALFQAITLADDVNSLLLAKGYPEHVHAYHLWSKTKGGLKILLDRMTPGHALIPQFCAEYNLTQEVDSD